MKGGLDETIELPHILTKSFGQKTRQNQPVPSGPERLAPGLAWQSNGLLS